MTEDQQMNLVWAVLALMLVGSSLAARRLPLKDTLRMALAWIAIFGVLFALFALKDDFGAVWNRVKLAALGEAAGSHGSTLHIAQSEDGHYHVNALVNGSSVRFMIDSGATTTAMSTAAAQAAGIEIDISGYPVIIETANGMAEARRARIATLQIGDIKRADFAITVSDNLGSTNLLGMNFLSSLKSWRVEGRTLILEP